MQYELHLLRDCLIFSAEPLIVNEAMIANARMSSMFSDENVLDMSGGAQLRGGKPILWVT